MSSLFTGSTEILSAFVFDTEYSDIPEEVIRRAKFSVLDWIGSAYSGKGSLTDRIIHHLTGEFGGRRIATLVGSKRSAPPMEAALYNGAVSSVTEIDDVHEEAGIHAGIGVIPAALAVAEHTRASGRDLIASIIAGYDITVRLARTAGVSHYDFWHSTGTCNTFGAAAAAGKLLRLDPQRLTMALGLSGTQASGLWESLNREGTMAKHLHSGKAASNGILSALLARDGFKGSKSIIEGEKGFLASSSKATEQDRTRLTENLGKPFLIMRNFFKRYACCRTCFEGAEGIHRIFQDHRLSSGDIATVKTTLIPRRVWLVGNPSPKDIYEAKFSLPFVMALIAVHGDAGLYHFNEENLHHPVIREIMEKTEIVSDPDVIPKTRVEVVCKDGSLFVAEPLSRSLDLERVKEKFIVNMSPLLEEKHLSGILSAIENLDKMEDIAELTRLLKEKPVRRIE
jgi:2-methylcitrate dehydratase PrpD